MAWILLLLASTTEIAWTYTLRTSEGFTKLWPTVACITISFITIYLLSAAMRTLPMGTAYALFTGIGSIGATVMGIYLFNEPTDMMRLLFVGLIIVGVVGLKFVTPH